MNLEWEMSIDTLLCAQFLWEPETVLKIKSIKEKKQADS